MAWIRSIPPAEADGELAEIYDEVRDRHSGAVDNILRIHSLHPAGLTAHYELYRAVMRPSRSLRLVEREMIALVVSVLNDCHY